jgi:hypothetical protein
MSKLIVNQIQASGGVALTLPNADGANGAFLVTDGSAQLDFQTIDVATNANVTAAVGAETTNRTAADALKANQATTYTKTEVDTADALKANQATTYTKTEVDANIAAGGVDLSAYDTSVQVDTKIAGIVDSAPETLNTLNELAAALGDDANHVTTMTTLVGTKADQSTTYTKIEVDNGFLDVATPVLGGNLDGAGYTYTNLHPAVTTEAAITGTYTIDFEVPVYSIALSGSTTFSISNCSPGKIIVVGIAFASSVVPSFPTEVKWAGDTEPTWADHTLWLISMTCIDTSIVAASATGFTV